MAPAQRRVDPERLPRLRAAAQLLHRPHAARDPAEVARAVAGIQAQDPFPARLSFRSRSRRVTAADVDRARTEDRSLLRTWLMRRTLHLIPTDDAGWWLPLFEPGIESLSRRVLEQRGIPHRIQEQALGEVVRVLGEEGPLTRTEVGDRLRAIGIRLENITRGHLVALAVSSGNACLGPDRNSSTCLVLRRDWLGGRRRRRFDREAALAELARRYIRAFGPATDRDFAYWSGLPLRDVRAGLEAISRRLEEVRVGGQALLVLGKPPRLPPAGQLRMLGAFDTFLLGYKDRRFTTGEEHLDTVSDGGGGIYPVILRDGVVIGGWRASRRPGRLEVALDRDALPRGAKQAVDAEIKDIQRFEGHPVNVIKPAPGTIPRP
jgi:Winged helix DNA-binding domain